MRRFIGKGYSQGHALIPYSADELSDLAAEDLAFGKTAWAPPLVSDSNIVEKWYALVDSKAQTLNDAKAAALAAITERRSKIQQDQSSI